MAIIRGLRDFKPPFRRLPILEAIKEYAGVDVAGMNEDELRATCKQLHVEVDPSFGKGKLIDAIFGEYCEKHLTQPTFITDYPVEMSPLTKRHRENPELTERFQEQVKLKDKGDDEAMFMTNSPTIQDVLFFPQMRPKSL